jgi:hypothetical protein
MWRLDTVKQKHDILLDRLTKQGRLDVAQAAMLPKKPLALVEKMMARVQEGTSKPVAIVWARDIGHKHAFERSVLVNDISPVDGAPNLAFYPLDKALREHLRDLKVPPLFKGWPCVDFATVDQLSPRTQQTYQPA